MSELLRLTVPDVTHVQSHSGLQFQLIDILRKGRKNGYVIASRSLLEETAVFIGGYRRAWLRRGGRKGRSPDHKALFIGTPRHFGEQEPLPAGDSSRRGSLRLQGDDPSFARRHSRA